MDTVDVLHLGESLGNSVTPLAWLDGLSVLVNVIPEGVIVDLLDGSKGGGGTGGCEALIVDILPVGMAIWATVSGSEGGGGSGDRFLDFWYRLECLLWVLYRLVPELNMPVAGWGRGSVIGEATVGGEVGAVWNGNIVPEIIGIEHGCRCCRVVPMCPRIVAMGIEGGDGSGVLAHIESPACIVCCKMGIVTG